MPKPGEGPDTSVGYGSQFAILKLKATLMCSKAIIVIEFQLNMDVSRMIFYANSSVTTCAILLIYLCCHLLSYYLIHTLVQDH